MSTRLHLRVAAHGIACSFLFLIPANPVGADSTPIFLDQGPAWTAAERTQYYSQDQGSALIQLAWLKALKRPSGEPFLADGLSRYGYLPNPANSNGLPLGFSAAGPQGDQAAGITCAACHTRQIEVDGKVYRIDGGPAITDIQSFFADLDAAAKRVLDADAEFQAFAAAVLGSSAPSPGDAAALRKKLEAWHLRYHTIMARALPEPPWGPARLDAVGMIFNRIVGLDVGPPPDYLIADNIRAAKAPVRYPFLWNATTQDKTQWAGFQNNGSPSLGLPRNLGEVYGVFGDFHPVKTADWWNKLGIDYLKNNSANFEGLEKLEALVSRIGRPKWPKEWPIDAKLAEQGKEIYNWPAEKGGCNECHGIKPGQVQFPDIQTWKTPVQDVGTDAAQYDILTWTAKTGVLQGAEIPWLRNPLKETDYALNVLATSVLGSIIQKKVLAVPATPDKAVERLQKLQQHPTVEGIRGAFMVADDLRKLGGSLDKPATAKYEAKVLEGVWAAAPYLHNGSVPTLTELLKPPSERVASFKVGPAYDIEHVGLAMDQTKFGYYTLNTTDCSDLHSGNSRCGHDYGTQLKPEEKKALIEYLNTL
jgi:hypothetical protein